MADDNGKSSKPRLSSVLADLRSDLLKGRIEDEFVFAERKFRMHTLSDGEAIWRDMFVSTASNAALLSSMRSATVAASISHVNGVAVSDLFELPDDPKLVDFLRNSPEEQRSFYRERMHEYMSEFGDVIISEFFSFYKSLEERRKAVIEQLKNSSKETESSISSSTSSRADGLPAAGAGKEIRGSSFSG